MARAALLAAALLATLALAAGQAKTNEDYPFNTVTAVAIRKQFETTALELVRTYKCATDDKIFLVDFFDCNFQFIEDLVARKKDVSPISCTRQCAGQWELISEGCYKQFRANMESNPVYGKAAARFFDMCDANVKTLLVGAAAVKPSDDKEDKKPAADDNKPAADDNKPAADKPGKGDKEEEKPARPTVGAASIKPEPKPAAGLVNALAMEDQTKDVPAPAPAEEEKPAKEEETPAEPEVLPVSEEPEVVAEPPAEPPAAPVEPASVYEYAIANGYTTLAKLIEEYGLEEALGPDFNITVFAPTDDAFDSLFATAKELNITLTDDEVLTTLTYHVSPSFLTAEDLTQEETTEIPTLAGLDLQAKTNEDGSVTISAVGNNANVVEADVMVGNAVIHVIDEVLLPIDLAAAQEAEAADTEAPPAQEAEATSGASSALASLAALAASVAAAALML